MFDAVQRTYLFTNLFWKTGPEPAEALSRRLTFELLQAPLTSLGQMKSHITPSHRTSGAHHHQTVCVTPAGTIPSTAARATEKPKAASVAPVAWLGDGGGEGRVATAETLLPSSGRERYCNLLDASGGQSCAPSIGGIEKEWWYVFVRWCSLLGVNAVPLDSKLQRRVLRYHQQSSGSECGENST